LSEDTLLALAEGLKINTDVFRTCLNSGEAASAVIADTSLARRIGITGTPTFLVNGKLLRGSRTYEQFKQEILVELKTFESNPRTLTSPSLSKGDKNDR
jgi:predicted DsbA family dithiol-disulfide isomerase